jgi:hypothetical protein
MRERLRRARPCLHSDGPARSCESPRTCLSSSCLRSCSGWSSACASEGIDFVNIHERLPSSAGTSHAGALQKRVSGRAHPWLAALFGGAASAYGAATPAAALRCWCCCWCFGCACDGSSRAIALLNAPCLLAGALASAPRGMASLLLSSPCSSPPKDEVMLL